MDNRCLVILLISTLLMIYVLCCNSKSNFKAIWVKRTIDNNINDYVKGTWASASPKIILNHIKNSKDILMIKNDKYDIGILASFLNKIKSPVILVTLDGDYSTPSITAPNVAYKILNHPMIKKWYTQNYDKSIIHPKLDYYPIGLDLHTAREKKHKINIKDESYYLQLRNTPMKRKLRILGDFHINYTHPDRKVAHNKLKNNKFVDFIPKKIPQTDLLKLYRQYTFVLSPRGNGLDCHRTWEILLLGAIPIVQSSPLDEMYIKHNLPVLIVKDYDILNHIDEDQLLRWKNIYEQKNDDILHKLTPEYWLRQ